MTQYNSANIELCNSQINKLKSATKNVIEVTLKLSSNMIGNSNDEANFSNKIVLIDGQVSKLRMALAIKLSTNINLSKTQLSKVIQSGGFLGKLSGSLLKTGVPSMGYVLKPLAKSVFTRLALTAAAAEIFWVWDHSIDNFITLKI